MDPTSAQPTNARRGKWIYSIAAIVALAIVLTVVIFRRSPTQSRSAAPGFNGDSSALHRTQIVPTLDTPLESGKNVIWCAAFQLSWKKLQKDVAGAPVQLQGADAFCAGLNIAADPGLDLPPGSFYSAAGWVDKGIIQTISRDMSAAFPGVSPTFPGIAPNSFLAYAYLQASVKFKIPYFEEIKSFAFTDASGKSTNVDAFGIREEDDYAYSELRQQPKLLYVDENFEPSEFAIDLAHDSQPVQIVVACSRRGATLADTLDTLEKQIASSSKETRAGIGINDVLLVPRIEWRIIHHFREIEGKSFAHATLAQQRMDVATQEISFKLDKSGMDLKAEAKHHMKPVPKHYLVNRPFLLYARAHGANHPFFVMWVENAELLSARDGGSAGK